MNKNEIVELHTRPQNTSLPFPNLLLLNGLYDESEETQNYMHYKHYKASLTLKGVKKLLLGYFRLLKSWMTKQH